MADILRVTSLPSSEAEIMSRANLSFDQFQRYKLILSKLDYLDQTVSEEDKRIRYSITSKGREYLETITSEFGRIPDGERSVWSGKKKK